MSVRMLCCLRARRVLFLVLFPFKTSRHATRGDGSRWMSHQVGCKCSVGRGCPARSGPVRNEVLFQCSNVSSAEFRVRVRRFLKAPPSSVSPEVARQTALSKVQKSEQALHLMSDCPGPAADVLKQELGKARAASKKPPIDVEAEQSSKFIATAGQMVAELDAERAAEFGALTEAKGRLQRREAELAAATSLPDPSVPLHSTPDCAEIFALKAKLAEVEGERDAALRSQSNKRLATMSSLAGAAASGEECRGN